jgi:hypothetical protein
MSEEKLNLTEVIPNGASQKANEDKTEQEKKVQDLTEVKPVTPGKQSICG